MNAPTHLEFLVDDLIERFRARKPIRTGSLIITFFGDIVAVRGGSLWLGSLLETMAGFQLGGGLVRTSVTRLVADGWLERRRRGRRSFYSFTPSGRARSAEAAERIYAGERPAWSGVWHVVLIPGGASEAREALRKELAWLGFSGLGPAVMVAPCRGGLAFERDLERLLDGSEAILIRGQGAAETAVLRRLAEQSWDLAPVQAGYQSFVAGFAPLRDAVTGGVRLNGFRALATRLLLVHEYRRILLRDPCLPREILPADWSGHEALALTRDVYRAIAPAAESWITGHCRTDAGPLPLADGTFFRRFGGLVPESASSPAPAQAPAADP